jgi:hypothetical protein
MNTNKIGNEILRRSRTQFAQNILQEKYYGFMSFSAERLQSLEMWNFTLPASVPSFRFPAGRGGGENKATDFLLRP